MFDFCCFFCCFCCAVDGNEVCGLKRKSDIGVVESGDAAVESSEKKQKLDDESAVAANGDC